VLTNCHTARSRDGFSNWTTSLRHSSTLVEFLIADTSGSIIFKYLSLLNCLIEALLR
jgi:hypothetical protein